MGPRATQAFLTLLCSSAASSCPKYGHSPKVTPRHSPPPSLPLGFPFTQPLYPQPPKFRQLHQRFPPCLKRTCPCSGTTPYPRLPTCALISTVIQDENARYLSRPTTGAMPQHQAPMSPRLSCLRDTYNWLPETPSWSTGSPPQAPTQRSPAPPHDPPNSTGVLTWPSSP